MALKTRGFLLLCLMGAALWAGLAAFRSIRPADSSALPAEIYRSLSTEADRAEYLLRQRSGYVAVYPNERGAKPEHVTAIALSTLRAADRAMLELGIPAADRPSMLQLLEDLGS